MKHFVNMTTTKEPLAFTQAENAVKNCFFQSDLKIKSPSTSPEKVNAVIMGRKTWDSIPMKFRPLSKRMNVILSNQAKLEDTNDENGLIQVFNDFEKALESLSNNPRVNEIFVIGGSTIYDLAINKYTDFCKLIIKTRINKEFEVDTFMTKIDEENNFTKLYITQTY